MSKDWKIGDRALPSENLQLIMVMKARNLDLLERTLLDVSTPHSANYGHHLSLKEIGDLTSDFKAAEIMQTFLESKYIPFETTINKDYFIITTSVHVAEELLATKFYHFYSPTTGHDIIRTLRYSLPKKIASLVSYIGGASNFPISRGPKPMITQPSFRFDSNITGAVNPAFLNNLYNISSNKITNPNTTQSLFESLGQSFSPSDLKQFQQLFDLPQIPIAHVIGPDNSSECPVSPFPCLEADLDVEYIIAVAQGANTTFWSIPANNSDIFLAWAIAVSNTTNPPLVHSMSYGSIENENDPSEMEQFSVVVQQLGTRGVSIIISSGDDGVANFIARDNASFCGFNPSFPATVPYVTAAGATQGPEFGGPEIACSSGTGGLITSGGGFSSFFNQSQANFSSGFVEGYLDSNVTLPPSSMFNANGRGYPDVAIIGHNYLVVVGGNLYQVSGTSCSSPVFAGMISLINDARLNANKPSLGFLNPALYSLQGTNAFNDITSGINNCCAGLNCPGEPSIVCCEYGFLATKGWDPVSGLGSPNFNHLMTALFDL